MSCKRALSPEQIEEAKELRQEGFTKIKLALRFNVGATTIYENIYISNGVMGATQQRRIRRKMQQPKFRNLVLLVNAIVRMKNDGYNSKEISDHLEIPLKEVNYIFGHF